MKTRHPESELQRECVKWFRGHYPEYAGVFYAVGNGGRRGRIEASIMNGEGVLSGVADLCLDVARQRYHGLKVEMKVYRKYVTKKGDVTLHRSPQGDEQKRYQKAVEEQGYKYVICASRDEFVTAIEDYLGKPKDEMTADEFRKYYV